MEDDEALLHSTKEFLEEEGFEIITASDGLEGIQQALNHLPDFIIADIAMPKLNGYKVYQTLQENYETSGIPFIFLTAKASDDDVRAGMQLGVDDYIKKPFDYEELLTTINTRIKKRKKIQKATEDKYEALLGNSLTGIFIIDLSLKIVFHNTKIPKMFDYDANEMQNLLFTDLIAPDDRENLENKLSKIFRGVQTQFSIECIGIDRKQNTFPIEIYAGKTHIDGKPGIIGNVIEANIDESSKKQSFFLKNYAENDLNNAVNYILQHRDKISSLQSNKLKKAFKNHARSTEHPVNITQREAEVLKYICQGYTNPEIAEKLFISQRTVDGHRSNLMEKTHSRNTAELVIYAVKNDLIII
jgi:PAS domain S-box-containing protein